jgi:iron-sulfur cluster assembly protein
MTELSQAQQDAFKPVDRVTTAIPKDRVELTPKAVEAVRAALKKRGTPKAALRLGIKGGGCSGYSYVIEFDDNEPRDRDLVFEFGEGDDRVRVFCDKKSILYLGGSYLDWEKTLMYQGFKFRNPHEATACGCGSSFTVA